MPCRVFRPADACGTGSKEVYSPPPRGSGRGAMSGWKVRLGDGSEIGPMDLAALRTWLAQGLVDGDSPVMRPGSRKWTPLATVPELKDVVGARPKAAPRPARARPGRPEPETAEAEEPTAARPVAGACRRGAAARRGGGVRRPGLAPGRRVPGLRRRALAAAGSRHARARPGAAARLGPGPAHRPRRPPPRGLRPVSRSPAS